MFERYIIYDDIILIALLQNVYSVYSFLYEQLQNFM